MSRFSSTWFWQHGRMRNLWDYPWVFLDLETTGLSPQLGDRICEVGLIRCEGLKETLSFSSLINPHCPISPGASAVNGITQEMVKDAPSFLEVVEEILSFLEGSVIICHNAYFDLSFLFYQLRLLHLPAPSNPVLDTLQLARRNYCFPSNSLGKIAEFLGISCQGLHRAIADARITKKIFLRFLRDFSRAGFTTLKDFLYLQGGEIYPPPTPQIVLPPLLQEALKKRRSIKVTYISSGGGKAERILKPVDIRVYRERIYLIAFCQLKGEKRTFRLDRIISMESA